MADPIEARFHALMNGLAEGLDDILNGKLAPGEKPKIGFILLTAEFGKIEGGRVNYISNGKRDDMLNMLREYLARAEGRYAEPAQGARQ